MNIKKIFQIDQQTKSQILSIIITAVLSAGLAFLQSLLSHVALPNLPEPSVESAGVIGASLRTLHIACK